MKYLLIYTVLMHIQGTPEPIYKLQTEDFKTLNECHEVRNKILNNGLSNSNPKIMISVESAYCVKSV